jgi:hypothetical protein
MRDGMTYRSYLRPWARIQLGKGWNGFFGWGLQAAHRARGSGFGANVAIVPTAGRWGRLAGGAGELLRRFGGLTGKAPRRLSAARLPRSAQPATTKPPGCYAGLGHDLSARTGILCGVRRSRLDWRLSSGTVGIRLLAGTLRLNDILPRALDGALFSWIYSRQAIVPT